MRLRRFRPGFDHLGLRITPSDVLPPAVPAVAVDTSYDSGDFVPTSNDPALTVDLSGTIVYASGGASGSDPTVDGQ